MSRNSIPSPDARLPYEGPIWIYVGRVAVEKNIEAFLALDLPGTKVVVGDGPATGRAVAQISGGEVPGRPDRRGADPGLCRQRRLRLSQPHRHLRPGDAGGPGLRPDRWRPIRWRAPATWWGRTCRAAADVAVLDEDLRTACLGALALARQPAPVSPRAFAESHSWRACTLQFLRNIAVEPDPD